MAKNDILFNITTTVDGKETIVQTTSAVRDLGKEADKLNDFKKTFNSIVDSSKPLKTQLGQLKKLMSEMEFNGMAGTEEFQHIAQYAGQMADAIGDANAQVKYFANDTKTLSTVVSGFQAVASSIQLVQGAMALFGAENKEAAEVLKKVQGAMALANGVQQVANLLNKDSALIQGVVNMQRKISAMLARRNAEAIAVETTATKGATIATKALNAVMKANPIGLVITAITTLIGLFAIFSDNADDAKDKLADVNDEAERLQKTNDHAFKLIGERVAETTGKFMRLAAQWGTLRSDAERTAWINNNSSAFKELGLKIKNVTDANEVFINQMPKILQVLKLQAEAEANLDLYMEEYKKRQKRINDPMLETGGKRYAPELDWSKLVRGVAQNGNGEVLNYQQSQKELQRLAEVYKLEKGKDYFYEEGTGQGETYFGRILFLTEEGREKVVKEELTKAEERRKQAEEEEDRLMNKYLAGYNSRITEAENLRGTIPQMFNPSTSADPYAKTKSIPAPKAAKVNAVKAKAPQNARDVKKEVSEKLTELEKLQKERDEIQKELDNPKFAGRLTKYEKNTRSERIKELDAEIARIKEWTGEMAFVKDLPDNALVLPLEFTIDKEKTIKNLSAPGLFTDIKPIEIDNLLSSGERNSIDVNENSRNGIQQVVEWFDAGLIGKDRAQEFINAFNAQMMAVGLEPIEVDLQANAMRKQITDVTDTVNILSGSLGTAFGAFNQLMKGDGEDEYGLMVGQIIAQTIATLSLSFANAMKSASSNWVTWLAFGLTGAAQLTSMIAQIKGLNSEGYASGGIIPGSSTSGDRVIARVNSGEMILNTLQQKRLFGMLNGTVPAAGATPTASLGMLRNSLNNGGNVTMTVSGRNLVGVLSNETRVSSKSGRKTNIKI